MVNKMVAVYIRVSGDDQKKEGLSLDAQKRKMEDYCQFKGWTIFKIYRDEGISGGSIKKRKQFKKMLDDSKYNNFSIILITKFDRAFRNTKEALITLDELKERKVDFVSIAEEIDTTTAMGNFFFVIISALAELERMLTRDRVSDVRMDKFNRCLFPAKAPFGYKSIVRDGKILKFIQHPKQAEIVKGCFLMASEGASYKDVCKKYKLKPQQYYNIIKNRVYCGYVCFQGEEKVGVHEKIISEELWRKVNEKDN